MWAMMLAGLPLSENAKLENIHFISTSNLLSAMEMADGPLVKDLNTLATEGMVTYMYHALLQRDVHIVAPIITLICDNPRASELLNHNGSSARRFCRMCMVSSFYYTTADVM